MKGLRLAEALLLATLIVWGGTLRVVNLGDLPLGAPETEEGTSWLAVQGQMSHLGPLLPSGLAYWKGWPYTLAAAASAALFGLSKFSIRFPSALAGTAAIVLAWWATRRALARAGVAPALAVAAALASAYVLAFSQWSILMSRSARFYELGLALVLAGLAAAIDAFADDGVAGTRDSFFATLAFGAIVVVATATFHPGALLLLLVPAYLAIGGRLGSLRWLAVAGTTLVVGLWFLGVLLVWKTGHVEAGSGREDAAAVFGTGFWKPAAIAALTYAGFAMLGRAARTSRGVRLTGLVVLVLLALLAAIPAMPILRAGTPLRSFRVLGDGHPGLVLLAAIGMIALGAAAFRGGPARGRIAALLFVAAFVPTVLVGGSTAHFVPRYLLFALGPLTIVAMAGCAVAIDMISHARRSSIGAQSAGSASALGALLFIGVPFVLLPAIGPRGAHQAAALRAGDPVSPLFAASPSRPYMMDIETPALWVGRRITPDDRIVSTNRAIVPAILGRLDAWYAPPIPAMLDVSAAGEPRNLITGTPAIRTTDQLEQLCDEARVFVIVDPQSEASAEVADLKRWLVARLGGPALAPGPGEASVFVLPKGCSR